MKTKLLVLLVFIAGSVSMFAQQSPVIAQTQSHLKRVDSIQRALSDELLRKVKNVDTKDTLRAQEQLNRILDRYADDWDYAFMNEMIRYRESLGLADISEENPFGVKDIFGIKISVPKKRKQPKKPGKNTAKKQRKCAKKGHKIRVEMGLVFGTSRMKSFGGFPDASSATAFQSKGTGNTDIGVGIEMNLDKYRILTLFSGFLLSYDRITPNGNDIFLVDNNRLKLDDPGFTVTKSVLRTSWIKVPLGLEIRLGRHTHWHVGGMGYAKFFDTSKQNIEFKDNYAAYNVEETRNFRQNKTVYGYQVYAGYGPINITFGSDITPYFKDYGMRTWSIGLLIK